VWNFLNYIESPLKAHSCQVVAIQKLHLLIYHVKKNQRGISMMRTILHFPKESQWELISQSFPAAAAGGGGNDRVSLKRSEPFKRASFEPTSSIAN
jgi:hypothetical protein